MRGESDCWLIEIDSLGNKVWEKVYGSTNFERLMNIIPAMTENRFLLLGYSNSPIGGEKSEASRGMNDFWVVNVSVEPNGINETTTPESSFSLYPNPATDRLTLYPTAITPEPMTVHLCDLTGKELQTLYTGILAENGTEIELKDRSAGIYLLQLRTASGQTTTQKLILQP